MADYYPALTRAVQKLEDNTVNARQKLYERARAIIIAELRRQDSESVMTDIVREHTALETAIQRIETEWESAQPRRTDNTKGREGSETNELDAMLSSLGTLLLKLSFIVGVVAFVGVIYVRGLALVGAQVIGYPVLLAAMAFILCLLMPLSWVALRKAWI